MRKSKMKRGLACLLAGMTVFLSVSCSGETPKSVDPPKEAVGEGEAAGEAVGEVQLKCACNTVKVTRTEDISALLDAKTEGLFFEGARGETEGAQLILRTEGTARFDVEMGDLTSGTGETIPSSAATVYAQRYAYTSKGFTGFPADDYPDALVPMEYYKKAEENHTEADKNQGIWIDLKIPGEAGAGTYTGICTVRTEDNAIEVPVSAEVYDFNMPSAPYMRSTYLIWQDWLMDGELDNTIEKYGDYYDTLLDYNLTAYYFPAETGDVDGFIACLRQYYPRVASYGIPYRDQTAVFEDGNPYGGTAGESYKSIDYVLLEEYLTAIARASKEDGTNYFEKMYYYFDRVYDEVSEDRYPQMRACIAATNALEEKVAGQQELPEEMAASLAEAKHLMSVVHGWQEEFAQYKELMVSPLYDNLGSTKNIEMYEELVEQEYTIESYGTIQSFPYPTRMIDEYLITGRDVFWSKFDYRLTGDLFWNVNGYCNWGAGNVVGYGRISDLYGTSCRDGVTDGDGYLFYPGRPYGSEKPFPSLRLMAVRDGIDDHSYLSLLEEKSLALAEQYQVPTEGIRQAIRTINEQIYATGTSKLNFTGLSDVRRTVARLIEMADSEAGLVLLDFDTTEEGVSCSLAAKGGTQVQLNQEVLTAQGEGQGSEIYTMTGMAYAESGVLDLEACGITAELTVGKRPEVLLDVEDSTQIERLRVNTELGSSVAATWEAIGGRSGSSARIELSGAKLDTDTQTQTYSPYVFFDVADIDQTEKISFLLYNSGEALEINITAGTEDGMTYPVDTIVLPANSWKEIEVGNLNRISRSESTLAAVNELRISTGNLIDEAGNTYKRTLYLGSVYQKLE